MPIGEAMNAYIHACILTYIYIYIHIPIYIRTHIQVEILLSLLPDGVDITRDQACDDLRASQEDVEAAAS